MERSISAVVVALLMLVTSAVAFADKPDGNDKPNPHDTRATATPGSSATATAGSVVSPGVAATPTDDGEEHKDKDRGRARREDGRESPGAGQEGGKEKERREGALGTLVAKGSSSFDLQDGDETVRVLVGQDTDILLKGNDEAGLADLPLEGKVKVWGRFDEEGRLEAERVRVIPSRLVVIGEVVWYDGSSITVDPDQPGPAVTFAISSSTRLLTLRDDGSIKAGSGKTAGDEVTVVGAKDGSLTAKQIVVHGSE